MLNRFTAFNLLTFILREIGLAQLLYGKYKAFRQQKWGYWPNCWGSICHRKSNGTDVWRAGDKRRCCADATIGIDNDEAVNEFETCAIVHKLDRLAPIGYSYGFNLQSLKFKNSLLKSCHKFLVFTNSKVQLLAFAVLILHRFSSLLECDTYVIELSVLSNSHLGP